MHRIGIGCTVYHKGIKFNNIDGIGIYSKNLLEKINKSKYQIYEYEFVSTLNNSAKSENHFEVNKFSLLLSNYGVKLNSMKELIRNIDLFHSTDYFVPEILDKPLIATLMDTIPFSNPEFIRSNIINKAKLFLWRRSLNSASHIITISDYSKFMINKFLGINKKNISVVSLGIENSFYSLCDESSINDVKRKYNLPNMFFLAVGTIQPRKNYSTLIDAYNLLPKTYQELCPLILIGKYGWGCDDLHYLLSNNRNPNIIWLKYVERQDLLIIYKLARAFFFISLYEGFGLPLIEAFASKIPVVFSDTTSLKEIGGNNGFKVDPYNMNLINEYMKNFIQDRSFGMNEVDKSFEYSKLFTWEKTAKETQKVYDLFMP